MGDFPGSGADMALLKPVGYLQYWIHEKSIRIDG
jgi:hypothetical protein